MIWHKILVQESCHNKELVAAKIYLDKGRLAYSLLCGITSAKHTLVTFTENIYTNDTVRHEGHVSDAVLENLT